MKTTIFKIAVFILLIYSSAGYSQKKSEQQQQMEELLNSKEFMFIAERAVPLNSPSITLSSTNNYVKFHLHTIDGYLPYFGRAYSGMPYGGDLGIMFNDKPSQYNLSKHKKNYEVQAVVNGESDIYKLTLTISADGAAILDVTSQRKSAISYRGTVSAINNSTENSK